MNTNALRQKILDLAIHGKLVKQDPADEPASVMLEKIRAEKEAKIAAGEIKRSKNDSYIFKYTGTSGKSKIDDNPEGLEHNRHYEKFSDDRVKDIEDEIPFAVPEGWAWCRLGEVCSFLNGFAFNSKEFKNTGIPIIRISNISYEKVNISNCVYSSELLHEDFVAKKGDLLVALSGATTGKMGVYGKEQKAYINQRVGNIRIVVNNTIIPEYRNFFLYSQSKKILTKAYGGAQPNIGGKDILEILLPLPPLAEQKRIVTAIETIFTQIDILETNKADLQTAVKQAKPKILDLAIRGKLVQQDPADEPASVMLEKLRAEKEAKIAAGEMKRGKNDSYIYRNPTDNCYYEKFDRKSDVCINNEIPFELPANWQWCRFGEVCDYGKCENIEVSELKPEDWILDLEDIEKDTGKIITFHSFAERRSESTKHIFRKGDLLYSKLRPYLNKVVIAPKGGFCTSEILPLNFNGVLLNEFAQRLLMSFFFLSTVNMLVYGVKMPRLGRDDAKKIFIPIPPIPEQKRIVARIEEIFNVLGNIQRDLI